jgi:hypothetical protein
MNEILNPLLGQPTKAVLDRQQKLKQERIEEMKKHAAAVAANPNPRLQRIMKNRQDVPYHLDSSGHESKHENARVGESYERPSPVDYGMRAEKMRDNYSSPLKPDNPMNSLGGNNGWGSMGPFPTSSIPPFYAPMPNYGMPYHPMAYQYPAPQGAVPFSYNNGFLPVLQPIGYSNPVHQPPINPESIPASNLQTYKSSNAPESQHDSRAKRFVSKEEYAATLEKQIHEKERQKILEREQRRQPVIFIHIRSRVL